MSDTKRARDLTALAIRAGVAAVESIGISKGSHFVMRVVAPNGVKRNFFMSSSPRCPHADKNNLSLLRRFVRDNTAAPAGAACA